MAATHPTHSELLKFASGNLSQGARKQLYLHLEGCDRCRAVVKRLNESTDPTAKPLFTPEERATRQVTDLLIGATLGQYRIVERVGQGGMGVLYRAVQHAHAALPDALDDAVLAERGSDEQDGM